MLNTDLSAAKTIIESLRSLAKGAAPGKWTMANKINPQTQRVLYGVNGPRLVTGDEGEVGFAYADVLYIVSTQPQILGILLDEFEKAVQEIEMYRATTDCLTPDVQVETKTELATTPPHRSTDIIIKQQELIKLLESALNRGDNLALTTEAKEAKMKALKCLSTVKL